MIISQKRHPDMQFYPKLAAAHLYVEVGGRKRFNQLDSINVVLSGERSVVLKLLRRPVPCGTGFQRYLSCPLCEEPCRVLRHVPRKPWLMCGPCTRKNLGARYASQKHFRSLIKKVIDSQDKKA